MASSSNPNRNPYASPPLAILGDFIFNLKSAPFDSRSRDSAWRWARHERVGARPVHQFAGAGDDTLTLSGALAPEVTGGPSTLRRLRAMADDGVGYRLVDGRGFYWGEWVIEGLQEQAGDLLNDGQAKRITFSLKLRRVDDLDHAQLGASYGGGG